MWKLKVLTQFILAHLPKGEKVNYLLQLLNKSHTPEKTARRIIELTKQLQHITKYINIEGSTVLEIGTGWDAISPVLFYLMGAKACYTYDHIPQVRFTLVREVINQITNRVDQIHMIASLPKSLIMNRIKQLKEASNLKHLFTLTNIIYNAPGDPTQTALANNTVDLVYSNAVLEHLPAKMIHDLTKESKRILGENGIAYHAIDLSDHYVRFDKKISKVNFLKYPEWLWNLFVKNNISYHNRLREKQFLDIFTSYGAKIRSIKNKIDQLDLQVLKTMKIDNCFARMTDEELAVHYSEIILSF